MNLSVLKHLLLPNLKTSVGCDNLANSVGGPSSFPSLLITRTDDVGYASAVINVVVVFIGSPPCLISPILPPPFPLLIGCALERVIMRQSKRSYDAPCW